MKISIIGLGAIGSLFAYSLKQASHQVSVWTKEQSTNHSLALDNHPTLTFPANKSEQLTQSELVLICVKSWQLHQALKQALHHIPKTTPILISHNGMGAIEHEHSALKQRPILFATTTHGALKTAPNTVLHTGKGETIVGAYSTPAIEMHHLAALFDSALPNAKWHNNIKQALWDKLAINCCINPLTAILNCQNGELNQPAILDNIKHLCHEIAEVIAIEGYNSAPGTLFNGVKTVIKATQNNYSSMHQDVAHQRVSEIDYITGYLLQRAQAHSIKTPYNQELYNKIKQLEEIYDH